MTNDNVPELRIEYTYQGYPMGRSGKIKIHKNGKVNLSFEDSTKDVEMSPKKIEEICKKMYDEGFFELDESFGNIHFDGVRETVYLDYNDKSRTITFDNTSPPATNPFLRSFVSQSRSLLDRL